MQVYFILIKNYTIQSRSMDLLLMKKRTILYIFGSNDLLHLVFRIPNRNPNFHVCFISYCCACQQYCLSILSNMEKLRRKTNAWSFYRSQTVLCWSKNLTAFSASSKTFVPAQRPIFTECKSPFCLAQNVCDCHNM